MNKLIQSVLLMTLAVFILTDARAERGDSGRGGDGRSSSELGKDRDRARNNAYHDSQRFQPSQRPSEVATRNDDAPLRARLQEVMRPIPENAPLKDAAGKFLAKGVASAIGRDESLPVAFRLGVIQELLDSAPTGGKGTEYLGSIMKLAAAYKDGKQLCSGTSCDTIMGVATKMGPDELSALAVAFDGEVTRQNTHGDNKQGEGALSAPGIEGLANFRQMITEAERGGLTPDKAEERVLDFADKLVDPTTNKPLNLGTQLCTGGPNRGPCPGVPAGACRRRKAA